MVWLLFGLLLFLGIHSVRIVLPGLREVFLSAWGEDAWKGLYSLVSLLGLVLIVIGYGEVRDMGVVIYDPPGWGRSVAVLLMLIAFLLLPFNMRSSRLAPFIKHPFLLAVSLWSFAHLLANGDLASVLLFGTFLVWAVVDRLSVGQRAGSLPPVAPLAQDIAAVGVAFGIWLLFVWKLHFWLFGVQPILT